MISGMEVWLHGFAVPGRVVELARGAEDWGFAGLLLADSQNLTADIWVELGLAAMATDRLRVGPGVTNPLTRHLAVTASAAATLQAETGGRATLGFAQGDSALSQIGRERLSVSAFERRLAMLQAYLRGEPVELANGTRSAIRWLAEGGMPKVPVHVAASGPRTIAAAARHAEGVDLTLGAELERLRWGATTAREAGPSHITVGAYLNVAVDPDRDGARELVRGSVATFARFSAGAEAVVGYETARHGEAGAAFAQRLKDEFVDRFAVAGTAEEVHDRLVAIAPVGIDRLIIVPGSLDSDHAAVRRSLDRFARDVLPSLIA